MTRSAAHALASSPLFWCRCPYNTVTTFSLQRCYRGVTWGLISQTSGRRASDSSFIFKRRWLVFGQAVVRELQRSLLLLLNMSVFDGCHRLLKQTHRLSPVIKNPRRTKTTIHKRSIRFGQENCDLIFTDGTRSDSYLPESWLSFITSMSSGFESLFSVMSGRILWKDRL